MEKTAAAIPQAASDDLRLLNDVEAAALLQVHVQFLRNLRSRGRRPGAPHIPFVKIGNAVRYRRSDLAAFVDAQTRRAAA